MAAKKDPYKRIQKRFVQARAGDVEYEDLSPEQRERFQNRFNMLAQSVEGRGTIARRILGPEAPQENVRALRQRIRQNLPSSGRGTTTTGGGTTDTKITDNGPQVTGQRLVPTSADIRNMQAGFRSQGAAIETRRASSKPTTTVTTKSAKGSDRIGSGFWSIPKSPITALKEMGQGVKDIIDYQSRAYVNPVINVAAAAADIVGGKKGEQKFKPLPTLTNREIALESAIVAGTAGAGKLLSPFIRPTGAALTGIGKALSRRGAVGTGAALSNIANRQAASAAVRRSAALQAQGSAAILRDAAMYGDDAITRGLRPQPSSTSRTPPKSSGMVKSPTAATTTTKKASTKKASTKKASTKPSAKPTTAQIEAATETYAGKGRSSKSLEAKGQGPVTSRGQSFNKEIGEIEMRSVEQTPIPARKTSAKSTKPAAVTASPVQEVISTTPKKGRTTKPSSVKPIGTAQPTRAQIEASTEKYAPGFNKEVGNIEMRSTQYEPIDLKAKFSSPVEEVKTPKPARAPRKATQKKSQVTPSPVSPVSGSKYPRSVESSAQKQEFDKIYGEMLESGYFDQGHGGLNAIFDRRKFEDVVERGYLTDKQVAKINKDAERMRADSVTREMAARKKAPSPVSSPPAAQPGQKAVVVKSSSEILWESMQAGAAQARAAQKAAFPGFTPKKVTKLPKRDPALNRLEERGSMLFRMYDEGPGSARRPSGAAEVDVQRGLPIQNQLDDVVDAMQGSGTGQFRTGEIPIGSKEVMNEVERTMVLPNVKIKRGEAINPRYTRRTAPTKKGEMPMPTTMSKGVEEFKPTRMPLSTERGLSLEQRIAKMEREEFPQARSNREARKLWEESRGIPLEQKQFTSGYKGGSPQGAGAKKSPVTTVEIKKPIKYEKGRNKKGEVVYKPVAFKSESVPAIETTSGPVPIEELPQRWNVSPAAVEKGRKARKAETLKSRAKQAARLRNRGIQGEARGAMLQESLDDIKKGKAFQRRFDYLKEKK